MFPLRHAADGLCCLNIPHAPRLARSAGLPHGWQASPVPNPIRPGIERRCCSHSLAHWRSAAEVRRSCEAAARKAGSTVPVGSKRPPRGEDVRSRSRAAAWGRVFPGVSNEARVQFGKKAECCQSSLPIKTTRRASALRCADPKRMRRVPPLRRSRWQDTLRESLRWLPSSQPVFAGCLRGLTSRRPSDKRA